MEKVKNAGWRRVQRRRNRNGSICTRVTDLRFDLEDAQRLKQRKTLATAIAGTKVKLRGLELKGCSTN